jgi:hypothetical protein
MNRNAPCPCGSGKRFKHCHGSLERGIAVDKAIEQRHRGDLHGAKQTLDAELAAVPGEPRALNMLGVVLQELHDLEGAEKAFRDAIAASPEFADAHFNLGILLLVRGDYASGWREYEWRTQRPGYGDYANYPFGMPRWQGEPLAGKRILVHAEQGFGDTLQCARFLEPLAKMASEVEVFCQPALVPVLSRIRGVRRVWGALSERPTQDFHAPIIDIAAHFLPSAAAPHWFGAYIAPLPERAREWASFAQGKPRPHVGIAWKGSAKQVNDHFRSLTPDQARALERALPGATLVNLQAGDPPPPGAQWLDPGARLRDWDDTIALVDTLDLVLSVDTAVAHVAGAMGKPVWTLRWFSPDWRWGASGSETRWYPSMRIFWQQSPFEWGDVMNDIAREFARQNSSSATSGR